MKLRTLVFLAALVALPAAAAERPLAATAFPIRVPETLAQAILDASRTHGVDPNFVAAVAFHESAFNPTAVSRRGAQGIMQLMPRTAKAMGVGDSFDVRENVDGGVKYLRYLLDRFHGDLDLTLAAYNAGPEAVARAGKAPTKGAETYVSNVKRYYQSALRAL